MSKTRVALMVAGWLTSACVAEAKTLVFCSEAAPETLNTMITASGASADVTRAIYNNLVQFKIGTTDIEPALASRWDISPDGLTYTFHLRPGTRWQSSEHFKPTRTFNADDVIFSFERQWKQENPYHAVSGGGYESFNDMSLAGLLASIDKIDDMTVAFRLVRPHAPFLADLAMVFALIQSREYADVLSKAGTPSLIDQQPIGTGPFVLTSYTRDATLRFKAFDGYWGPKPKIDNLVFAITKDPAVRLAKLRADECQVGSFPNLADIPAIRADPTLQLLEQPGLNVGFLAMNVMRKPFDDVRVRRAFNMAIDRRALLDNVYQGSGVLAKNLIPPTMWGYNDDTADFAYDPDGARTLLKEAGYPDGFSTDLWTMPVQRPYNPDSRKVGEMMQADLAKVGIKATINTFEWGEYIKRVKAGEAQTAQFGWTGDNGDPDNFFTQLSSCAAARVGGSSSTKWCDRDFDALIGTAATSIDKSERTRLYKRAQVLMHEAAPYVLLAHSVVFMPMRASVKNYVMDPFGIHVFSAVDLDR